MGTSASGSVFSAPNLTGPVIDELSLLNDNTKNILTRSLQQLQKEHGIQLQVYIAKSLQEETIETAAIKLFDEWKLGDEKTDKGILFLIAPNEKRLRIEVGQGLEGDIPDVIAKRIISDEVKPFFQQGDFNSGIIQGVLSIQRYLGVKSNLDSELKQVQIQTEPQKKKPLNAIFIFIVIGIWLLLFMFNPSLALYLLFSILRGGGGGGGGGDSWSGRGGKSSGGGASGGW